MGDLNILSSQHAIMKAWLFSGIPGTRPQVSGLKSSNLETVVSDSDTLIAARSQPNDNWGSVGNGAKHGEKHVGDGSGM